MTASTTSTAQTWPQLLDLPLLHQRRQGNPVHHNYAPLQLNPERVRDLFVNVHRASVYLHIPFCRELCSFCNCNVIITKQYSLASQYVDSLRKEINWYGEALANTQVTQTPVLDLYIGGGTPTYLMHEDFRKLHNSLANNFRLTNAPARDYTVEIDPRSFDRETAEQVVELGFNRIHFGLEDFSAEVQQVTNRKYSLQRIENTFALARKVGITNISVDLVYGLPKQTVASFIATTRQVMRMQPSQVIMRLYQNGVNDQNNATKANPTPNLQTLQEMQKTAMDIWLNQGYKPYGSQGFRKASDDKQQGNDEIFVTERGYTPHRHDAQLGFGLATTSNTADYWWQNQSSLRNYTKQVNQTGNAAYQGMLLSQDDQMRLEVANNLLCNRPLNKFQFEQRWHCSFNHYFADELNQLSTSKTNPLLNNNETNFHLRPEGQWCAQILASFFLAKH